jgi:alpha-galactosidase
VRAFCLPALLLTATSAAAATGSWSLATGDTRVTIAVAGNQITLSHLRSTRLAHDWAAGAGAFPLMRKVWIGEREAPTEWLFQQGTLDRRSGALVLTFANASPRLRLRSIWRARPGHGPVEHWLELDNLSGERVTVPHQESLSLSALRPGGPAKVWWIKRGGGNASTQGGTFAEAVTDKTDLTLTSNCEDGASPVPWLAVQVGEQRGLYVGWEFSGVGRIQARADGSADRLEVNVGLNPDFRTDVEPGTTFVVPPAFVGCYAGDVDEGSYCLHRFILEKLRPAVPKGFADPTLAYNLYLDAGSANAKEPDVLRSAALCRQLGFETFVPDAMWFPEVGDWRWDPKRFPQGVRPVERYVHTHGMKLGLWCAWTNAGLSTDPGALSVRGPFSHPDWFSGDFPPDWKPAAFSGGRICLACPEAREWARKKTRWLVADQKLDYLKHDIGPIVTGCNKTTHGHRYGVDVSYWATKGYYRVQEKLREAFPRLVLENCSGGGHLKDFGVIKRTHYTVTTDTLSNLPDRQSLYDSTFAFPPLVLQAYTYENVYPVKGDNPGPFLWRSAMMGAWQIDPSNTARWTDEERDSARRAAAVYKRWIRPVLADVKVHHILPRPDGVHWDGMFYWSARLKRGTLYLFRPEAKEERQTIRLRGLDRQQAYWVWCEDGSVSPGKRTGAELMDRGLPAKLPQQYTSDLVYVQAASLGKPGGLDRPGAFRLRSADAKSDPFTAWAELTWYPSPSARTYRVLVSESPSFATTLAQATVVRSAARLSGLPPQRRLHWKVEGVSWGGRRWNDGGAATLRTPGLQELPGVAFVSDLQWATATAGAENSVHRDTNYYGKPITLAGKSYPKGVWTHAFPDDTPADLVVALPSARYATFAADVGVEAAGGGGTVVFQVLVNGEVKARSPVMAQGMVHRLRVDVAGATAVTLRVLNGGDGYACDHAAWGSARFLQAGAKDLLEGP